MNKKYIDYIILGTPAIICYGLYIRKTMDDVKSTSTSNTNTKINTPQPSKTTIVVKEPTQ